ncbi:hypothetical protein [Streptomyces sp. NBC_01304]|uniref:hypothetical protein n=1 Tax=Streptomyces sp. NBC_01304 TaxID=2903818 RepID=UPI002E0E12A0|nr:hypothetical protein OG430_48590 [Streptomyces sp. NBC_01304]
MMTTDEVTAAFAQLPDKVTTKQIAEATGRKHIHNWSDPSKGFVGFPAGTREGRTVYRDKDAVLKWYLQQSFAQPNRRGRRDLPEAVRSARPVQTHLTSGEIAETLGITRRAVNKYADHYTSDTADPFPLPDPDGERSWSAVRAWLLRHNDPLPKAGGDGELPWAQLRSWLLRNHDDTYELPTGRAFTDELGLTLGERDLLERARLAQASGVEVSAQWLAETLGQDEDTVGQLTAEASQAPAPALRMRPAGLARSLGLTADGVTYWAKTRTPGVSSDPFPAADADGKRSWSAVHAWLQRRDDPLPEPEGRATIAWPVWEEWLLRRQSDTLASPTGRVFLDDLGLTLGERDVLERVRLARAAGARVPTAWLAAVLRQKNGKQAELLLQSADRPAADA